MKEFESKLQRRLAQASITSSALRNQGNSGLLEACRKYCQNLDLDIFFDRLLHHGQSKMYLDSCTEDLREEVKRLFKLGIVDEQHLGWGTTRKALNLFFAAVVSNHYFALRYSLPIQFAEHCEAIKPLEVPLDSHVADGLKEDKVAEDLIWPGVKHLTPDLSMQYQLAAIKRAECLKLAPIHMDIYYWRREIEVPPINVLETRFTSNSSYEKN